MQEEGRGVKIAHFSFANAQRDGQLGCSPKERLVAIYRFFAWASQEGVHIIGCTEGHRSQNDMDWTSVLKYIKEKWGYDLVSSALLGDQSSMSFGSWLFHVLFLRGSKFFGQPVVCEMENSLFKSRFFRHFKSEIKKSHVGLLLTGDLKIVCSPPCERGH